MSSPSMFSLEYFPPRDIAAQERLVRSAKRLMALQPGYVSVTFGAGGSTREGTVDTVQLMQNLGADVAPHLSCIGATRAQLRTILDAYQARGVRRLVALRGDMPSGMGGDIGELHHAADLVRFVRAEYDDAFHIEVAAYPEMHPQSLSAQDDLDHFVAKVSEGADGAITQYFFNPDAYFDFVDRVRARGIDIPIIPGIMPILNLKSMTKMVEFSGRQMPADVLARLRPLADDPAALRTEGIALATEMCRELLAGGAPGLHFYTLNRSKATREIWAALQER